MKNRGSVAASIAKDRNVDFLPSYPTVRDFSFTYNHRLKKTGPLVGSTCVLQVYFFAPSGLEFH